MFRQMTEEELKGMLFYSFLQLLQIADVIFFTGVN